MFTNMFRHIDLMQRGMDAAWMRQEVISHNIANADTPGYKAQHVEFEGVMRKALEGNGHTLQTAVTHDKHIRVGGPIDPRRVQPVTVRDTHYTIRMDGNNVDIDHQMTELAANYIRYSVMQDRITGNFNRLKMVIREGR